MVLAAAACGLGAGANAQDYRAPRIGRYQVYIADSWVRDLVIENDREYAVYELRNGPLYGRGTYSFDGQSVRFLTGPYYEMGFRGSSFVEGGKHQLRLGMTAYAVSVD